MIFTLNAGSSSLKFSLFDHTCDHPMAEGLVERIGQAPRMHLTISGQDDVVRDLDKQQAHDHPSTVRALIAACRQQAPDSQIAAVGHRVVHGGPEFDRAVMIDSEVLQALKDLAPFAPLHQPHNVAGIEAAMSEFPNAVQVACFDTAFHRGHPFVNDTFGLPHRYYEMGVRRYGFHGLSYQYIVSKLAEDYPDLHQGRVVVAHLGSGASMCAIKGGQSIDSTMSFSVLDGLPMGTRCGQVDPGAILFLLQNEELSADDVSSLLYKESGLIGMSGISNDIRELDASEDPRAKNALEYMAYRIRREIGGMAATMGGLDGLVFTGGIGEHHAWTRANACHGMGWLGITIDEAANKNHAPDISTGNSIPVLVLPTNEELVIARATRAFVTAEPS